MIEMKMKSDTMRSSETMNKRPCPGCGGAMAEVERVNENGFLFVWYECMQADCGGQWLEKKAANIKGY